MIATLLARLTLWRLRHVDPKVACELKLALERFNRRTKRWSDVPIPLSENA